MKKILVTGGAGLIGSNIAKDLIQRQVKVVILDDFSHANFKNILDLNCEIICGDVTDDAIWKKIPKVDGVIHEAAITDTTLLDDRKMVTVNFEGFKNAFSFSRKLSVPLVYASSAGVYGDGAVPMKEAQDVKPLNTYAYSKVLCDRFFYKNVKKTSSPHVVGVRYFNVYGPGEYHKCSAASMIYQLYLQMKAKKQPRVFCYGEQARDFIYVKDVARMTVDMLLINKNVVVNIGTGKKRSFNDIISALNAAMNTDYKPDYFKNPYLGLYQDYTEADVTLLKSLKNQAKFSLEEGIKDYVKNYLNVNP